MSLKPQLPRICGNKLVSLKPQLPRICGNKLVSLFPQKYCAIARAPKCENAIKSIPPWRFECSKQKRVRQTTTGTDWTYTAGSLLDRSASAFSALGSLMVMLFGLQTASRLCCLLMVLFADDGVLFFPKIQWISLLLLST
jgi:hypothetical protein